MPSFFILIAITTSDKCDDKCDAQEVFKRLDKNCPKQEIIPQASAERHSDKGSIRFFGLLLDI